MQCFVCITYLVILCAAQPTKERAAAASQGKRSLFRDVIESLRIRSQLPEEINHTDDNNLSQNYDRYGLDKEALELPSDANFIPRRNDRIEMPTLKYRFPKTLRANGTEIRLENKKEDITVYVNTPTGRLEPKFATPKPKKEPKPNSKANNVKQNDFATESATNIVDDNFRPIINRMEDLSQIGNREYQTVIKPTVIVNFRGTVSHSDSDIRLEKKNNSKRKQNYDSARNIFNINQEIKLVSPNGTLVMEELGHRSHEVNQEVGVIPAKLNEKDVNMTICETSTLPAEDSAEPEDAGRIARANDNILQIIVTV